jgi:triphosphoribosyl-dephospho-CoA synthase
VSLASPGHRMDAGQFIAAATAAAEPISSAGASVGQRIESAVRAAWDATRCNTNLGIVLLCAPLLAASECPGSTADVQALRAALEAVLQSLDVPDTRAAYRAIALARPAGLGRAPEQDVFEAPTVGLREAMALAAGRDRIAWQYVHAFADVFDLGLPAFRAAPAAAPAMQRVFLEFLACLPDSHIVRKHGDAVAQSVMREAAPWCARARLGGVLDDDPAFRRWDEGLKERGLNPGTSADLCVAVALTAALLDPPSRFP